MCIYIYIYLYICIYTSIPSMEMLEYRYFHFSCTQRKCASMSGPSLAHLFNRIFHPTSSSHPFITSLLHRTSLVVLLQWRDFRGSWD